MNGDQGSSTPSDKGRFTGLTNEELIKLYDQYQIGSDDFNLVKSEMISRGYTFEEPTPSTMQGQSASEAITTQPRLNTSAKKLRYSKGVSFFWALFYFLLGSGLFVFLVTKVDDEPSTKQLILYGVAAFMVYTLGALISGVRNLANRKDGDVQAVTSGVWQTMLGVFWVLAGLACLIYAVKLFIDVVEWDLGMALSVAAVPLCGALICVAFAITLITMAKEIGPGR